MKNTANTTLSEQFRNLISKPIHIYTHIHNHSFSLLGTATSIQKGRVGLI